MRQMSGLKIAVGIAATIVLAVGFLAAAAGGCRQMPDEARELSYRDDKERFALDVPRGWVSGKKEGVTLFMLPLPGGEESVSVSVTVSRQGGEGEAEAVTAEGFLENLRRQLSQERRYEEDRACVLKHPNGLRAAYIEGLVGSEATGLRGRRLRLYGFVLDGRRVVLQSLIPTGLADVELISKTNAVLDSFIVW